MNTELKPIKPVMNLVGEVYEIKGKKYSKARIACPRCGGTGNYSYNQIDGTMCLKCRGGKYFINEVRLYTEKEIDAYNRKQERARQKSAEEAKAREAENLVKWNLQAKRNRGFWKDDYIYAVNIEKAFDIKDQLKADGARWNNFIDRWYFEDDKLSEKYPLVKIYYYELVKLENGYYETDFDALKALRVKLESMELESKGIQKVDGYFGKVGDKIELKVTVIDVYSFDVNIQWRTERMFVNKMVTEDGHLLVWKTTATKMDKDSVVTVKGTIKSHEEYAGEKQTVLTRCKIK